MRGWYLLLAIGTFAGLLQLAVLYLRSDGPRRVVDDAGFLSEAQVQALENYHEALLDEHDIDYRVVISHDPDSHDNNRRAFKLFAAHEVGTASSSGRGLLLLIDPVASEVRLEVASVLESVFTDAWVSYIQHRQMIPFFRTGRVAEGVLATTELMVTRAQAAANNQAFLPPADSVSRGAGVTNPAELDAGRDDAFRTGPDVSSAGSPLETLAAYRAAMAARNGNPHLSIYTLESRRMLEDWQVTPAQMDNEADRLADCPAPDPVVQGTYAVARFPVEARFCPPYFFRQEDTGWKLDLTMMQKAIRFNHRNQWRFDPTYPVLRDDYGFAFNGWRFDENGFPHAND